jgi:hypothetical protein
MTGTKGKSGGSRGGNPGPKHKILKITNPLESFFPKIPTQKQGYPESSSSKDTPRSPDSSSEGDNIEDEKLRIKGCRLGRSIRGFMDKSTSCSWECNAQGRGSE